MTEPLIRFENVQKSFGANHVMKGVNLSIFEGEITAVIGKSGCGKSVLLKHIIGLMKQDSGVIYISGKPLSALSREEKREFKDRLSYMFQQNALFDFMSVYDNIALPLAENSKLSREQIKERVDLRMAQLGIEGTGMQYPAQLSGGMQKRVALARALVTDPAVVLFDEPTTGLDPVRKKSVHKMIRDYQQKFGFTAVVVSHEIPEIFDITQRVAMLDKGVIVFEGDCESVMNSDNETVNSFIKGEEQRG